MRTSLLLAWTQLRRGWRSLVGVALLVGLFGGLVLAGLAGAQRTRTAVDRMIEATDAADVLVNPDLGDESALDFDAVAALPMVADFSRLHGVGVFPAPPYESVEDLFSIGVVLASDGGAMHRFDRPVVFDGRVPDPNSVDEIYLDRVYASREGIHVGDSVVWRVFAPQEFETAFAMFDAGDAAAAFRFLADPTVGSPVELRVVGIGGGLDGVAVDDGYEPPSAFMGPELYRSLGAPSAGYGGAAVRLRNPEDLAEFKAAVDAMVPDELIVYQTQGASRTKAVRATQPAAAALAIFTAVTALLGLLVVGQAISRRFQLDAGDNHTLAALGTTQRERFVASVIRLTGAAGVGALLGLGLAWLFSSLTPVGPAIYAEPDPGIRFDVAILLGGTGLLLAAVVLVGLVPAWRSARHVEIYATTSGSSVASWLAARGAPVEMTTGVRFGLEPGRGSSSVPTRATIIGAFTAVVVAAATIVFASSLDRVVADGRFSGSNFDLRLEIEAVDDADSVAADDRLMAEAISRLSDDVDVERVGEMRITEIAINGEPITSVAFSTDGRAVAPTIGAGREPAAVDEIALGGATMRDLGVGIGDTVSFTTSEVERDATVVGRVVLPGVGLYQGSDRTSLGTGALVSPDALGPRDASTKSWVVVDLDPTADRAAFEARTREAMADFGDTFFERDVRPSDIQALARLRSLPVVLSGVLILLVAVTVVHAMVVAVRRRRRDVAILQALGSTSRAVIAIGVWQGITIAVAALLVGIPVGIVAGRWLWIAVANGFGTLAEPVVPLVGVALLIAAVLMLAAAAGVVPIRRGLRHRPADVLRSE